MNADDNESKDDNGRTTTKREHNDEGQGRDKEEPPTKSLTSQCARRCQLTPALLLQGFSVAFGGIPMHGLHTPGFSNCTHTCRNPYPWARIRVFWDTVVRKPFSLSNTQSIHLHYMHDRRWPSSRGKLCQYEVKYIANEIIQNNTAMM